MDVSLEMLLSIVKQESKRQIYERRSKTAVLKIKAQTKAW